MANGIISLPDGLVDVAENGTLGSFSAPHSFLGALVFAQTILFVFFVFFLICILHTTYYEYHII